MKITIGKTDIYIDPKALREAHRLVVSTLDQNKTPGFSRSLLNSAAATLERLQTALARESDEEVVEEAIDDAPQPARRRFTGMPLGVRHYIQQCYAAMMKSTPPTEANKTNTRVEAILCAMEELVQLHHNHTEDILKLDEVVSLHDKRIREADLRRSHALRTMTEALA